MSERMESVEKSEVLVYKSENVIFENIQNESIYKILNTYGYDEKKLTEIFVSENYTATEQHNLNAFFRKFPKEYDISLIDVMLFLEKLNRPKRIVYFLDTENKSALKAELAKKYRIKIRSNDLLNFLGN